MLVDSKLAKCMGMVSCNMKMGDLIRVSIRRIRSTVKASMFGQMVKSTKEVGGMVCSMEWLKLQTQKDRSSGVFGRKVKELNGSKVIL